MKILHLISSLGVGGAEMTLVKLLRATACRIEPRVVSLTGDGPIGERIRALGVETVHLGIRRGVPDPRAIFAVAREIRRFGPDIVQTWMYHADLIGGLAALLADKPPVIWGIRGADLDSTTAPWTTLATLRACAWLSRVMPARIVSCSERARGFHSARGYAMEKMVLIPNGFDTDTFAASLDTREAMRRQLRLPRDAEVVGMVARYHPMKDFCTFSRAAGILANERPGAWFVLCGEGVTTDNVELTTRLQDAGVLERTRLLGRRDDVPRVLAALDLFTLTSITEGFPNVVAEAMAAALPCVTTDAGDCRWILGGEGAIVPTRSPAALAAAWGEWLGRAPEERRAAGHRARERIAANFSMEAVASRFLGLYEEVLART